MPCDMRRYPKNWKVIRARIQSRAGDACEWCQVPNGAVVHRDTEGRFFREDGNPFFRKEDASGKQIKIVCTTAHLGVPYPDGRPGNKHDKADCRDENLAFLCQRCHLNFDRDEHRENAARTRRRKHEALNPPLPL